MEANSWLFFAKSLCMKKIAGFIVLVVALGACAPVIVMDSQPKSGPPGQVKKATGSQSAKAYAPGQQKKKN